MGLEGLMIADNVFNKKNQEMSMTNIQKKVPLF